MTMSAKWVGLAALLSVIAGSAVAIEIPLQYKRNFEHNSPEARLYLGSVRLANRNLLAESAAPAPFYLDFETSEAKGLTLIEDRYTTVAEIGGRRCRCSMFGAPFEIVVEDALTSAVNSSDVYLLLEYYDQNTTDALLRTGYSGLPDSGFGQVFRTAETTITNTRAWKKQQFKLKRTAFGLRKGRIASDLRVFAMPRDWFSAHGYANLKALKSPPQGDYEFPPLVGEDPFYVEVELGEKKRLAVVDRQTTGELFYDRVRFDANGNRNLADDAVITGTIHVFAEHNYRRADFPEIETEIEVGGRKLPARFEFDLYSSYHPGMTMVSIPFEHRVQCSLRGSGYYAGELELGGRKYKLALGDSNCNGRYDDKFGAIPGSTIYQGRQEMPYYRGDTMYLTREDSLTYEDGQLLGDTLVLADRVYDVVVDPSGTKLTLDETSRTLGQMRIPQPARKLQLKTGDFASPSSVMAADVGREFLVPTGTYQLYTYMMERRDEQGDLWLLGARGTASTSTVVAADAPGTLVFGEPFTPFITAGIMNRSAVPARSKQWWEFWRASGDMTRPGRKVQLSLEFGAKGVGGDIVSGLSHVDGTDTRIELSTENPQLPKEPAYKIVKEDGEIVTQGSFAYG